MQKEAKYDLICEINLHNNSHQSDNHREIHDAQQQFIAITTGKKYFVTPTHSSIQWLLHYPNDHSQVDVLERKPLHSAPMILPILGLLANISLDYSYVLAPSYGKTYTGILWFGSLKENPL